MVRLFLGFALMAVCASASAKVEIRNGWYFNETPGNHVLVDKDGQWIIGVQGGYQADWLQNSDPVPNANEFVNSNGVHGYACLSMKVDVDTRQKRVLTVISSKQLLLKTCLEDWSLPMPRR